MKHVKKLLKNKITPAIFIKMHVTRTRQNFKYKPAYGAASGDPRGE